MATLNQTLQHTHSLAPSYSWISSYNAFLERAEFNRFGWSATTLMTQGCVLTPLLLLSMFYYGGSDWQFLIGNLCFLLVLVPVLAAQPVKYIFPAFAFSAFVHVVLILANLL